MKKLIIVTGIALLMITGTVSAMHPYLRFDFPRYISEVYEYLEVIFASGTWTFENINTIGNATLNIPHGDMCSWNDTGDAMSFTAGDTYYNFTFEDFSTYAMGYSDAGDYLEAQIAGHYFINYHASGSGDANSIYKVGVAVNNEVNNCSVSYFRTSNENDVVNMAGNVELDLSAGDQITLMIKDITGAGDGKRYSSQVLAEYVGA